ncbi:AMP-binding enzyme family protein (macronuclear) [Tetrahymena thermophila SB210]|uniref:AMP-binding enzyme family protein n=1 Tax=Tetrahymena thermophila (strain SB210) TaxID=312017 RepID=Q22M75_TETTS|nr:AMP-binding enzyme family protein [Tetrahymena thermophila SB210]EAR86455.3 AMP-binding enzyme family protein [Tetrahymena thermophila SB210]|eukprot:XP_977145.3 AMP-binding enzyme family protein [Tetrahymena thermophila SB210]
MIYSKLDLFSSQFSFNVGNQLKKGTLFGTILTVFVILGIFIYFLSIMYDYANNYIEPSFRSQTFIHDTQIDLTLNKDLVAFRYEYDTNLSIDLIQKDQNKTYVVYMAQFYLFNRSEQVVIQLDVIDCTNPILIGFKCLNFSKILNHTLSLDTKNSLISQININTYGCYDQDDVKTYIPENCASQKEIDRIINGQNAVLRLQLLTSQYNTSSQEVQNSYRNAYVFTLANQQILSRIKIQKQVTSVKKGLLIQEQTSFSSPISYTQQDQTLDRNYTSKYVGVEPYSKMLIYLDEVVQQTEIQYPSLPQVFSQVNSTLTLLMMVGVVGRAISLKSIRKDFLLLFLNNIYQDTLFQVLKQDCLNQQLDQQQNSNQQQLKKQISQEDKTNQILNKEEEIEIDDVKESDVITPSQLIPSFYNKFKQQLDGKLSTFSIQNGQTSQLQDTLNFSVAINEQQNIVENTQNKFKYLDNLSFSFKESQILNQKPLNQISQKPFFQLKKQTLKKSKTKESIFNQKTSSTQENNAVKKKSYQYELKQKQEKANEEISEKKNSNSYKQRISEMQKMGYSDKVKNLIFGYKICKRRQEKVNYLNTQRQIQAIQKQLLGELNILNFFSDFMFLKKAIMLILTQDQLAALKCIGLSSNILDLDQKNIENSFDQYENSLSHYEKQNLILKSEKLQQKFIDNFMNRCSGSSNKLNDLDIQILSQLKQSYINK